MTFEAWFSELKRVAVERHGFTAESAETMDAGGFRPYFDSGLSAADAMAEDMSYA